MGTHTILRLSTKMRPSLSEFRFCVWSFVVTFVFCGNPRGIPRLNVRQDGVQDRFPYERNLSHTVFYYHGKSDSLFIGGTNYVLQIDLQNGHVLENYTLSSDHSCREGPCENVVTTIEDFLDGLFVCGTDGERRQCWRLFPKENNRSCEVVGSIEGIGIAPHTFSQNSLSLSVDGDLYTAAPLYKDGSSLQFRRTAGKRTNVWMYDKWVTEPTFISAFSIPRENNPDNEKIYVFVREKNSDSSPEADPWISRVARVCKADEGGSKRFFQNIWTSFLKARLVCGIPSESLYFNRLQDIHVQHEADWRRTRVYALFFSSWNSTAVCIYSMEDIDRVFENSSFKGYNDPVPNPRPGACVRNSKNLPIATITVIKEHSEMTDWIHPIHRHAPFYVSSNNYTKIAVDRVEAANNNTYNVLLLATDTGTIHKILENDLRAFIISETRLYNLTVPIQSMKLDSKRRKLMVGYPGQMSYMDLQRCQNYNKSCEDCVLARDPYCSWTSRGCTAEMPRGIQNIADGKTDVCHNKSASSSSTRTKRATLMSSPDLQRLVHSVPLDFPFYLSCPIDSHHATYTWEHEGRHSSACQQAGSNCLHLIPAMGAENYGNYTCVSRERDYTRVVKKYQLLKQERPIPPPSQPRVIFPKIRGDAAKITSHLTSVIMVVLMVELL
ncbi:semaphorin-7A [Alosa alosa]|uniref:semaphorin-7A n=1 Tax=Alosa alosa TaxID=278164 RepID=UPI00201526E2|nr:semaphorin-7A [Alosa alosa]